MTTLTIRSARKEDFEAIWPIFYDIIQTADTYCNAANTTKEQAYN
jgi:hypothetical protein